MTHPPTHRCTGSKDRECSIRLTKALHTRNEDVRWRLAIKHPASDGWGYYLYDIVAIDYCPFCGAELKEETP